MPRGIARRGREWSTARALRRLRPALAHDPAAPVLLLSPHWDDAVFDCWALLTAGVPLRVVNVFGGVPVPGPPRRWDRITGAHDAAERARERIAEDAEALALAGREALNLPLLDGENREPEPEPTLTQLDRALVAAVPSARSVFAPACLGANDDHRLVRLYARALHAGGIPVRLYADLPYCITHGWPSWVDGSTPDPHRDVDAFWATFSGSAPELRGPGSGFAARLDDGEAEAKLRAMRAYRSQLPALDGGPRRLLTNPATHSYEVYWALGADPAAIPELSDRR